MSILSKRVDRLERPTRTRWVVVWQQPGETIEQATARWRMEHPGKDLVGPGLPALVVGWDDPTTVNGAI